MVCMKKVFLTFFSVCLISFFHCVTGVARAQDITLMPTLDIGGEYNDNATFTRTNKIDDFITTISPALTFDYATELLNLESTIAVDFLRYADERDLNTENQKYAFNGDYRITERWRVLGNFSYIEDTTLESELEETGFVNVRQDRKRYNAGGGMSYQVSELSDIGVNYAYMKTDYDFKGNVDYDSDAITLSYDRQLGNQLDVFTAQPYWLRLDSRINKADSYGLSFGWSHRFSETLSLKAFLGGRYTKIEPKDGRQSDETWGVVTDINLRKTGETTSASISYSRNIYNSAEGEPIEVNRFYCDVRRMVIGRLGVRFSGNLYFTKAEGKFSAEDRTYFELIPSLYYKLTESHSLQLAYSYSQEYDKTLTKDREAERNRVWISLNFRFPRKL